MIEIVLKSGEYPSIAILLKAKEGKIMCQLSNAEFVDLEDALAAFKLCHKILNHFQRRALIE